MILRDFLRLYTFAALLGGLSFWPAACASLSHEKPQTREGVHASLPVSPVDASARLLSCDASARAEQSDARTGRLRTEESCGQSAAGLTAGKTASASFERESPTETVQPETERLLVVASPGSGARAVALSRGVRHDPARTTTHRSLLRDEPGSYLSSRDVGTTGPTIKRGWQSVTDRRDGHLQSFEDAAAWKDMQQDHGSPERQGWTPMETVGIKAHRHLQAFADSAAHLCGVPVALLHRLFVRESGWDPNARSSSGALGLGQLMPASAREMGVTDRLDPWQNAVGSACYLRRQFDRFGTWRKALHAYHGGPNRLRTSQASRDYAADIIGGSAQ